MTDHRDAAFLRSILKSSSEIAIICTNLDGNILHWNTGAENIFGYTAKEVEGTQKIRLLYSSPESQETMGMAKTLLLEQQRVITREIRECTKSGKECWIKITLSPHSDQRGHIIGILGIAEDITTRKTAEAKLQQSLRATIHALINAVEAKDPYTAGHQQRVADLAVAIAQKMCAMDFARFSNDQLSGLSMAAKIHDLGKLAVPTEILSKPAQLSDAEFGLLKVHPQAGFDIIKDVDFPWPIADIILQHHEKRDGSGYPQGMNLIDICLDAQILTVADVVEAMVSHRPYRAALPLKETLQHIEEQMDFLYNQHVVAACLSLFREDGYEL